MLNGDFLDRRGVLLDVEVQAAKRIKAYMMYVLSPVGGGVGLWGCEGGGGLQAIQKCKKERKQTQKHNEILEHNI